MVARYLHACILIFQQPPRKETLPSSKSPRMSIACISWVMCLSLNLMSSQTVLLVVDSKGLAHRLQLESCAVCTGQMYRLDLPPSFLLS